MRATEAHTITATEVSDDVRFAVLPKHFRNFVTAENLLFQFARMLIEGYDGGYWRFYELSNGGCYFAIGEGPMRIESPNGFARHVSADAAGAIVSLFMLSHLAMMLHDRNEYSDHVSERFHLLRAYVKQHPEADAILSAVD